MNMSLPTSIKSLIVNQSIFRQKVVKDFAAVVGSELALRPIQLLKEFIVTKFLGPADYGILKSIELVQMLNKYGTLGFKAAAAREIGDAFGKKDQKRTTLVRNTAYSSEIILALVLFVAGITSSLFFESRSISILIILASAGLLVTKLSGILYTEAGIQKRFFLISKVTFITSLLASIIVIVAVPFFKIYAVVLMNFVTSVMAIIYYLKSLKHNYSFMIDGKEFKRILSISVPLMFVTLSQGAFKYAERILVISLLGKVALGFYVFGFMMVNQFVTLFKAAIKVRTQDIYEAIGREDFQYVHRIVFRETLLLVCGGVILIPIMWFSIQMLVPVFLPQWSEGIYAAQLSLLVLPFQVMPNYSAVVIESSLVNQQKKLPVSYAISAATLISCAYLLRWFDRLSLENFILGNLVASAYFSLSLVFYYKKYFYNNFVRENKATGFRECIVCGNTHYCKYKYDYHLGFSGPEKARQFANLLAPYFDSLIPKSAGKLKRFTGNVFKGNVLVCSSCGYGTLDRQIRERELIDYYDQYWHFRDVETKISNPNDFLEEPRAIYQLQFVRELLGNRGLSNVLEIGAGRALTLQLLRAKNFPEINLFVCEPGPEWSEYYAERKIQRGAKFFPFKSDLKFEYIHTSHWLEHALDLEETIVVLRDLLSPGGMLFVEVPNTEHDYWQLHEVDHPHIHFFTQSAIQKVFKRFFFRCLKIGEYGITMRERNQGVQITEANFGPRPKGFWIRALFQKQSDK